MAATPGVPESGYMEVNGFAAPPSPNQAELLTQGYANPAFKYAFQQKQGLLPQSLGRRPGSDRRDFRDCASDGCASDCAHADYYSSRLLRRRESPQFVMTLTGTNFQPGMSGSFRRGRHQRRGWPLIRRPVREWSSGRVGFRLLARSTCQSRTAAERRQVRLSHSSLLKNFREFFVRK